MNTSTKAIAGAVACVLAGVAVFIGVYTLRGSDQPIQAGPPPGPPGAGVTPIPGSTPDTSLPFWHIPYINQDNQRPRYSGLLNGFTIDPGWHGKSAYDVCPGTGLEAARSPRETVSAPGPLQIEPSVLPGGVSATSFTPLPDAWLCKGEPVQFGWSLSVEAGTPDVNPGGSALYISRIRGREPVIHAAPKERWSTTTVAGSPAIVSSPIVVAGDKQFGACFVAVYQEQTDVMTTVLASAANDPFCLRVAEAVLK